MCLRSPFKSIFPFENYPLGVCVRVEALKGVAKIFARTYNTKPIRLTVEQGAAPNQIRRQTHTHADTDTDTNTGTIFHHQQQRPSVCVCRRVHDSAFFLVSPLCYCSNGFRVYARRVHVCECAPLTSGGRDKIDEIQLAKFLMVANIA